MHFHRILNRLEHLITQSGGAPIPEELPLPGEIEQGHGIASAEFSLGTDGHR